MSMILRQQSGRLYALFSVSWRDVCSWLKEIRPFGKAEQKELAALIAQKTQGPLKL